MPSFSGVDAPLVFTSVASTELFALVPSPAIVDVALIAAVPRRTLHVKQSTYVGEAIERVLIFEMKRSKDEPRFSTSYQRES